ncbi:MAG: gamma-glutamylcyclotransferase family protein [Patescibacteria group bacterium]
MCYFAYGSNLDTDQLKTRFEKLKNKNFSTIGVAILTNYDLKFNKKSKNGSGKANIIPTQKSEIEGVVFELTDEQFKVLDEYKKGYHRNKVSVNLNNQFIEVTTYIADVTSLYDNLFPTNSYLDKIIKGAKNFNLSDPYQKKLHLFKTK